MPKWSHCFAVLSILAFIPATETRSSGICDELAFALSNVANDPRNSPEVVRLDNAIGDVEAGLSTLDARELAQGCSTENVLVIGSEVKGECQDIAMARAALVERIQSLTDRRLETIAAMDASAERQKIVTALHQNRCDERQSLAGIPRDYDRDLVVTVPLGEETISRPSVSPFDNGPDTITAEPEQSGSFRTLCVRSCDGGFFPVSSYASTVDFSRDARICANMCPGVETELFYTGNEEESATMRSVVDGKPYSTLPHAFAFRKSSGKAPGCSCDFAGYSRRMANGNIWEKKDATIRSSVVRIKSAKTSVTVPIQGSSPNTDSRPERPYRPDPKIRNVGPAFFPDETKTAGNNGAPTVAHSEN